MVNHTKVLLQNLQDTYSGYINMTLYMTDREGNPMTNMSGISPFVEMLVYQTRLPFLNQLKKVIDECSGMTTCIVVDAMDYPYYEGVKVLVQPIIINGNIHCYIWCWSFIDEGISDFVKAGIELDESNAEWKDPVFQLPVLNQEQLQQIKKHLAEMSNICAELLKSKREHDQLNEVELLVNSLKETNIQYFRILEILKRNESLDYIGIASLSDGFVRIKSYLGPSEDSIIGSSFIINGSFFEDVFVSKSFEYWGNIGFDPRLSFLMKNGIKTGSFFCCPVTINKEVQAFLFGGKTEGRSLTPTNIQRIRILGIIVELGMNNEWFKSRTDLYLMKLSILMEISKSMKSISNLQDMLLMITNIASSLVPSHFTSIHTKYGHYEFLTITNRISDPEINDYLNKLRSHYFDTNDPNFHAAPRIFEKYETLIVECPIFIADSLYAIISVALQRSSELKEAEVYLSSLAGISSLALKSLFNTYKHKYYQTTGTEFGVVESRPLIEQLTSRELDVLKLVVKGMSNKQIGDELYISTHTVKNHISNIFNKLGVNDRTQIIATFYALNNKN